MSDPIYPGSLELLIGAWWPTLCLQYFYRDQEWPGWAGTYAELPSAGATWANASYRATELLGCDYRDWGERLVYRHGPHLISSLRYFIHTVMILQNFSTWLTMKCIVYMTQNEKMRVRRVGRRGQWWRNQYGRPVQQRDKMVLHVLHGRKKKIFKLTDKIHFN